MSEAPSSTSSTTGGGHHVPLFTTSAGPASRDAMAGIRACTREMCSWGPLGMNYNQDELVVLELEYECAAMTSRNVFRALLARAKKRDMVEEGGILEARIKLAASVFALVETDADVFEHVSVQDFSHVVGEIGNMEGADRLPDSLITLYKELLSLLKVQACLMCYFQWPEGSPEAVNAMKSCVDRLIQPPSNTSEDDERQPELTVWHTIYGPANNNDQLEFRNNLFLNLLATYDFEQVFSAAKTFARVLQMEMFGVPKIVAYARKEQVGSVATVLPEAEMKANGIVNPSSLSPTRTPRMTAAVMEKQPSPVRVPVVAQKSPTTTTTTTSTVAAAAPTTTTTTTIPPYAKGKVKFSLEEEEALKRGVSKHGEGNWKAILEENVAVFSSQKPRTTVDLKDKWRNLKRML